MKVESAAFRQGATVDFANRLHLVGVIVPATAIVVVPADQAEKRETGMRAVNMRTERAMQEETEEIVLDEDRILPL
ncbi:MAG: hypothetical protein ASARMPREDX12_008274 [Alectoria sarmentosa]|nr:MAG: hypothetical protein ASARMPREDX12_008274 [Alectoria sarmentosa]